MPGSVRRWKQYSERSKQYQTVEKGRGLPGECLPTQEQWCNLSRMSRAGGQQHTAYLPLSVHEQLRKLAFEEDRKIHDYLIEGLNRVLPTIKELN